MKYMGSKARIAKKIIPIIEEKMRENSIKTYIEPFCGGCNVIDKIQCETKIASDNNKYLIEMFKNINQIQNLSEFVTKEHYLDVRDCYNKKTNKYPNWYIGEVGFLASYNGRFFDGGYAGIVHTKDGTKRNYYDEAKRNLSKQVQRLKDIQFQCGDYEDLYFDKADCLFYCDIPYKGTQQYGSCKNFDYVRFWKWAKRMSEKNIVLVSEHEAPSEWECIWQKEVKRTINSKKHVLAIEKIFEFRKENAINGDDRI